MEKMFSKILGNTLVLLAAAGYVPAERKRHLLGLMNIDKPHSVIRTPMTLALLYGGTNRSSVSTTRAILTGVGTVYLLLATLGIADKKVGGALPSGLTKFDVGYHYLIGSMALWLGLRSGRMLKP